MIKACSDLGVDAKGVTDEEAWEGYENIKTEENDIDSSTHVIGRTYVYNKFLAPFEKIAKSLSAILVLEGDRLPEDWIAVSNTLDFVYTASTYGMTQFINNGIIKEKIKIIPHGIDPKIFYPKVNPSRFSEFTFGFCGGFAVPGDRKGCDTLVKAFSEEFKPTEKVKLMLKINTAYNPQFDTIGYLGWLSKNNPNIVYFTEPMQHPILNLIYNAMDIQVLPSKGEAFSMNLAEGMACGKTCIATNWSGYLDYCKPEFTYLTDVERFEVAHYGSWDISCGTKWAVPSFKHLKEQMRYAFDNQDDVRKKGKVAQRYILDNYLWRHAGQKLIDVLNQFQ